MSERLAQNRVLQYVVISYMKKHFSVYLVCIAAPLYVWKSSEFHFMLKQKFHRLESVDECPFHDFKTDGLVFVFTFATNFDVIFKWHPSVLTYSNKLAPTSNRFSWLQSEISMGNGSKGLRLTEDFVPSSQSGTLKKKITSRNSPSWDLLPDFLNFLFSSTLLKVFSVPNRWEHFNF